MGILSRAKQAVRSARQTGRDLAALMRDETLSLSAEIPGSHGPLCQLRLELRTQPQADGEHIRICGHLRLRLPTPAAPQAAAPVGAAARLGRWLERRLASPLAQTLAAPLVNRELNSWVDVQTSTAALDAGSKALLPERLQRLGIQPSDERRLETWAGALPNARGLATMTLLRLDKQDLPPRLRRGLGRKPLQLTAAVVAVLEEDL